MKERQEPTRRSFSSQSALQIILICQLYTTPKQFHSPGGGQLLQRSGHRLPGATNGLGHLLLGNLQGIGPQPLTLLQQVGRQPLLQCAEDVYKRQSNAIPFL